jgi:hypothetical protein
MIAIIAGDADVRRGPIPIALAHAGFETREAFTTDQADRAVEAGGQGCVLVVDASSLERGTGTTWSGFLTRHPAVAAVVVSRGSPGDRTRAAAGGPHRILVGDPFDAAAVVTAARRAAATRARPAAARVPAARRDVSGGCPR